MLMLDLSWYWPDLTCCDIAVTSSGQILSVMVENQKPVIKLTMKRSRNCIREGERVTDMETFHHHTEEYANTRKP